MCKYCGSTNYSVLNYLSAREHSNIELSLDKFGNFRVVADNNNILEEAIENLVDVNYRMGLDIDIIPTDIPDILKSSTEIIKIKYCPMCGRKFE